MNYYYLHFWTSSLTISKQHMSLQVRISFKACMDLRGTDGVKRLKMYYQKHVAFLFQTFKIVLHIQGLRSFSQQCSLLSANEMIPYFKNNYSQDDKNWDKGIQSQKVCCESGCCTRADSLNELNSLSEGTNWISCHRTI